MCLQRQCSISYNILSKAIFFPVFSHQLKMLSGRDSDIGEGMLSGRIDAYFRRDAARHVLLRDLGWRLRRIQRDSRHARHKHDIFFRLDAKRKGPVDRIYIADVDVIVHDHGDLAELGSKTPGPAHDGARLDGMALFNRDNQIGRGAAGLEEMDAADGKTEVFDEMFV